MRLGSAFAYIDIIGNYNTLVIILFKNVYQKFLVHELL